MSNEHRNGQSDHESKHRVHDSFGRLHEQLQERNETICRKLTGVLDVLKDD